MRNDKNQALKLRLNGKSYSEIENLLGIPKSTLSGWFTDLILSTKIKNKLLQKTHAKSIKSLIKRNVNQTFLAQKRAQKIKKQAIKVIGKITPQELLLIGASLYWAEGYKRPIIRGGKERTFHTVSITNSDPLLIKIFIKFLREYCGVPLQKIKGSLRIYQHHNEKELIDFWHQTTKIPLNNFGKTYRNVSIASKGKRPFNRLPYGVIQVVVADTKLFHTIIGYIEGIKKIA